MHINKYLSIQSIPPEKKAEGIEEKEQRMQGVEVDGRRSHPT